MNADILKVVIGGAGCTARQQTVKKCWQKIPGVISVRVLPRQSDAPGGQRAIVIVSKGASPSDEALRTALARRAKHYPILHREGSEKLHKGETK